MSSQPIYGEEIMRIITILLLLTTSSAYAEVYKCQLTSKKIQYQAEPCSANTADKDIVKIKNLTPQQKQEAENRLKALEKERQALDKAEQEQQEAAAARREAEAARRQSTTTTIINPYPVIIPYPSYDTGYYPNYNRRYTQNPIPNHGVSPNTSYSPNPGFSPNPNPSFAPYPISPYPPPYMPAPVFRSNQ